MSTAHIAAKVGEFADIVITTPDPTYAKNISKNFLRDVKQITTVRNMLGFTGYYKDKKISVMSIGIGIPSTSIYIKELVQHFGVKYIINISAVSAIGGRAQIADLILVSAASTDTNVNRKRLGGEDFAAVANFDLLNMGYEYLEEQNKLRNMQSAYRVGSSFSTDFYYHPNPTFLQLLNKMNYLCLEMSIAEIYGAAHELGVKALAVAVVTTHTQTKETIKQDKKIQKLEEAAHIALNIAIKI